MAYITADLSPVKSIVADYRGDEEEIIKALGDHHFDVVADFLTFTKEQMEKAIRIFTGRTDQYIFISSGTVYKKPLQHYIITEDAPKGNYHSAYARNKLACERALMEAYEKDGFPGAIVRPSLTYSDLTFVLSLSRGPYSLINRMRRGKQIIVQGDGNSLFKATVSFEEGAKRVVDYFDADPAARIEINDDWDAEMDDIIYRYTAYKRM